MTRKCILGIFALLFISYNSYAQQNTEVIVTLKGGHEVKGTITEEIPGESITIKTTDGDLFIYRNSEIAKIHNPNLTAQKIAEKQQMEREKNEKKIASKQVRNTLRAELKLGNFKGYRGIIDVGCSFGGGYIEERGWDDDPVKETNRITASIINGGNFGPHLFIGLGVGIEYGKYDLTHYSISGSFSAINIPVFLNIRTAFLKERRVSPYLSINAGYSIPLSQYVAVSQAYNEDIGIDVYTPHYVDGSAIYLEPSFGLEFRIKQKSAISVAFVAPMYIRKDGNMGENRGFNISLGGKLGFSF